MLPSVVVLLLAACLDFLIGDPWQLPHPVQSMGAVISYYSQFALKQWSKPLSLRLAGILLTIGLLTISGGTGWLIVKAASWCHPLLGMAVDIILLASCFAGRSLRDAASEVLQALASGSIELARASLSKYVGRDTDNLSEAEILRAVLETVAENATDGATAPLFYGILGAAIADLGLERSPIYFPVCVLPLAYKAASTLDSMVGYREAPYTDLGWCSAKLEDCLTWLPCRCTVISLALLSGKPFEVWQICRRDAIKDPSPNSGWSEGIYAAILGVQLGGTNYYRGIAKHKPLLGEAKHDITATDVNRALQLTRYCLLSWLVVFGSVAGFFLRQGTQS